jgi:hypothetical protein
LEVEESGVRVLRHIASALLILGAALLAVVGALLVGRAFNDPPEAGPGYVGGIGVLLLAFAGVIGWAAWAAHRSGSRAQLLLLALVAALFALVPTNSLIGPPALALNVLCGVVAGVALLAFLRGEHHTKEEAS